MKKKVFSLMLTLALSFCIHMGLADGTTPKVAVIDGKTSDRVHLRKEPSATSDSLGLYFTGTEALCDSNADGEWAWITVGTESGYMKTEHLYFGDQPSSIKPKQPSGVVTHIKANSWVNLRFNPMQTSSSIGTLYKDDTVIVLGETATKWYYVNAGGVKGYVMADFLRVVDMSEGASHPSAPSGTQTTDTSAWRSAISAYQGILQSKGQFYSTDDKMFMLIRNLSDSMVDGQLRISTFAVVDLDNDGTPELILSETVDGNDDYGFEVLHYRGNVVYGYHFVYRALMDIKQDGTFSFSSGAADNGFGRAAFTDSAYQINPITYVQSDNNGSISYVVNQKSATEQQFHSACKQQAAKPDVSWTPFTDETVDAMNRIFERAAP